MIVAARWEELIDMIEAVGGNVHLFEYYVIEGMYVAFRRF